MQTQDNGVKTLFIEGQIALNTHCKSAGERFRLERFEVTAKAFHGMRNSTGDYTAHPLQCLRMSPMGQAKYSPVSQVSQGFTCTLNPTPTFIGQVQYSASEIRTCLGESIHAMKQTLQDNTVGTVWYRSVKGEYEQKQGSMLGTFTSDYKSCPASKGCNPETATTLSVLITAILSDSHLSASSKKIIQTLYLEFPDWSVLEKDSCIPATGFIHSYYDTEFSGDEIQPLKVTRDTDPNPLPVGVTYKMSVTRERGSGFKGKVLSSKCH